MPLAADVVASRRPASDRLGVRVFGLLGLGALLLAAPAAADRLSDACKGVKGPDVDCTLFPAMESVPKELVQLVPKSFPSFQDAAGPEWSTSSACNRSRGKGKVSTEGLCSAVAKECMRAFGHKGCKDETIEGRRMRYWNHDLRQTALEQSRLIAVTAIKSPALHDECCGVFPKESCEYSACIEQFRAVRFQILRVDRVGDKQFNRETQPDLVTHIAHANNTGPQARRDLIIMDEGMALSAPSRQWFEGNLLHELGHACQVGILHSETACQRPESERASLSGTHDPMNLCDTSIGITERHLQTRLGDKTAKCIKDRLLALAATNPKDYYSGKRLDRVCRGRWLQEAYADVVFFKHRRTLSHFGEECGEPDFIDFTHGPKRITLDCLFENQEYVDAICEEPAAAAGQVTNGRGGR